MITPALDTAALDIRLDALLAALSRAQRGNKTLHRAGRRGFEGGDGSGTAEAPSRTSA